MSLFRWKDVTISLPQKIQFWVSICWDSVCIAFHNCRNSFCSLGYDNFFWIALLSSNKKFAACRVKLLVFLTSGSATGDHRLKMVTSLHSFWYFHPPWSTPFSFENDTRFSNHHSIHIIVPNKTKPMKVSTYTQNLCLF